VVEMWPEILGICLSVGIFFAFIFGTKAIQIRKIPKASETD